MRRNLIFQTMLNNIIEILPQLDASSITQENSLRALGANSIDRAEILIQTMAKLKLKIPLIEFANAKNIGHLIEIFEKYYELA